MTPFCVRIYVPWRRICISDSFALALRFVHKRLYHWGKFERKYDEFWASSTPNRRDQATEPSTSRIRDSFFRSRASSFGRSRLIEVDLRKWTISYSCTERLVGLRIAGSTFFSFVSIASTAYKGTLSDSAKAWAHGRPREWKKLRMRR